MARKPMRRSSLSSHVIFPQRKGRASGFQGSGGSLAADDASLLGSARASRASFDASPKRLC